ncbi:carboxypeptidase-like regulatory domain-containing protein [Curtobacterium sp. YR515]|uniref:carboxypeptidase-like regulatory domain-containing protein n=1 Tax=Curtobacterium sp. YR515 TaxID=1855316 RepID=UPI0008E24034|nr:carboxypeptidase-like regulatory domain-containing protein [Curtobacterium sp. YR515]SFF40426.1 Carboxypeptidase regulatory-like domain-containing protein [Curtobacterium sp. YR515]
MRQIIGTTLVVALATAALIGVAPPANAAASGTIAVQLATPDGTPIRLADVELAAIGTDAVVGTATTDADGTATFAGIPAPDTVTVTTRQLPPRGTETYAPGLRSDIAVRGGTTVAVTVPLVRGATVQGGVVGPSGPAAGRLMYAWNEDTSQVFRTTSDSAGRYRFLGLSTGQYRIEAYASGTASPAVWKTRVYQQRGTLPASQVTLSQHYAHSDYDLAVFANTASRTPSPQLSGANVVVTEATSGASFSTRFSTLLDDEQTAQFQIPSGQYVVELRTTATTTTPAGSLWLGRPGGVYRYVTDRAQAVPVKVVFGGFNGWGGTVPEAASR